MEHKDSWKNINVFKKQLSLNKEEFLNYPQHWNAFINLVNIISKAEEQINLLDIGCGCGSYYKICLDNLPNVTYFGIDYSREAISLAKDEWKLPLFETMDLFEITSEFINQFNVVHMGALLDVLPNGNEALEFILNKRVPYVLIGRIDLTQDKSGSYTYKAYDEITTYKYLHNVEEFKHIIEKYNYNIIAISGNSILIHHEKNSTNNGNIGTGWIVSD
jgi:trans-aconitate methyltransferase